MFSSYLFLFFLCALDVSSFKQQRSTVRLQQLLGAFVGSQGFVFTPAVTPRGVIWSSPSPPRPIVSISVLCDGRAGCWGVQNLAERRAAADTAGSAGQCRAMPVTSRSPGMERSPALLQAPSLFRCVPKGEGRTSECRSSAIPRTETVTWAVRNPFRAD